MERKVASLSIFGVDDLATAASGCVIPGKTGLAVDVEADLGIAPECRCPDSRAALGLGATPAQALQTDMGPGATFVFPAPAYFIGIPAGAIDLQYVIAIRAQLEHHRFFCRAEAVDACCLDWMLGAARENEDGKD